MGVILAITAACVGWIVLWGVGFGRTGDAFIVTVVPISLLATMGRAMWLKLARARDES